MELQQVLRKEVKHLDLQVLIRQEHYPSLELQMEMIHLPQIPQLR